MKTKKTVALHGTLSMLIIMLMSLMGLGTSTASAASGWAIDAVVAASNTLSNVEKSYPDGGSAVVKSMAALGKAQMDALDYKAAEKTFERAFNMNKKSFKNISGDFRHALLQQVQLISSLADCQMKQGNFDDAEKNYQSGLHMAKLGVAASTPEVKHMRTGHIVAIARRSTKVASASLFKQLMSASERASGFVSDDMAMILYYWIQYEAYIGHLNECEDKAKRLVDVTKRVYGSDHPEVAEALILQASVIYDKCKKSGDNTELKRALPLLQSALKIRRAAFGSSAMRTKQSMKNIEILQAELKKSKS